MRHQLADSTHVIKPSSARVNGKISRRDRQQEKIARDTKRELDTLREGSLLLGRERRRPAMAMSEGQRIRRGLNTERIELDPCATNGCGSRIGAVLPCASKCPGAHENTILPRHEVCVCRDRQLLSQSRQLDL
jgi:hypothetical protein